MDKNNIQEISIDTIIVGVRRRDDYGDVESLSVSIKTHGLLHPITVDADLNLIAGGRRLEACRLLGWKKISAKVLRAMKETDRRAIELAENQQRKNFTDYEASKLLVDLARESAEELRKSQQNELARTGQSPLFRPDNERAVLEHMDKAKGVKASRGKFQRAKKHVAAVEADPSLMDKSQGVALKAADEREGKARSEDVDLLAVSTETRERIDKLISEHGYKSEQSVLESAVETLYTLVTNERKPPASVKKRIPGPTTAKFQPGDLCSDKGMGAICRTTLHPKKHHPDCPKFPA